MSSSGLQLPCARGMRTRNMNARRPSHACRLTTTRFRHAWTAMYLDKLDGRIDAPFFDRKAADWRREQDGILRNIQVHQDADQSYIEDGIQLLELASDAHELFLEQEPREKRRLLAFMVL